MCCINCIRMKKAANSFNSIFFTRVSKKQAQWYAILYGFSRAIGLFSNSAAFYLGGILVNDGELEFHNVFK